MSVPCARRCGRVLALQRVQFCRGTGRFLLANGFAHRIQTRLHEFPGIKWRAAGQQLIEQNTQRIDVVARVNIQAAQFGLFGAHVGGCADKLFVNGEERFICQELIGGGFGDPEINDFGNGHTIVHGHKDVGRLDITMYDLLRMSSLQCHQNLLENRTSRLQR